MRKKNYRLIALLIFSVFILILGLILNTIVKLNIRLEDLNILLVVFAFISFITLTVFFKGQRKEPDSQTMHTLVAIGIKFLLEMLFALVWFIIAKKSSLPFVLLFFVLYLSFTFYTITIILKTLKYQPPDNKY
jgi:hypothetical protein